MSRLFSAYKDGVVVRRGTFTDEALLREDLPSPEYTLVLDAHHDLPASEPDYREQRRYAYPPLADLADALYWQAQGDDSRMDAYVARVARVKALIPKQPDGQ